MGLIPATVLAKLPRVLRRCEEAESRFPAQVETVAGLVGIIEWLVENLEHHLRGELMDAKWEIQILEHGLEQAEKELIELRGRAYYFRELMADDDDDHDDDDE
jgi:hypothetical protein